MTLICPGLFSDPDESVSHLGGFCMLKAFFLSVETIEAGDEVQTCRNKF